MDDNSVNRRQFVQHAAQIGAALGMAGRALGARPGKTGRVIGANDRINIGAIGVGGRGSYLVDEFSGIGERDNGCQILAVCDVYRKRARINAEKHKCESTLDYLEIGVFVWAVLILAFMLDPQLKEKISGVKDVISLLNPLSKRGD